jgi:hypothetical protein
MPLSVRAALRGKCAEDSHKETEKCNARALAPPSFRRRVVSMPTTHSNVLSFSHFCFSLYLDGLHLIGLLDRKQTPSSLSFSQVSSSSLSLRGEKTVAIISFRCSIQHSQHTERGTYRATLRAHSNFEQCVLSCVCDWRGSFYSLGKLFLSFRADLYFSCSTRCLRETVCCPEGFCRGAVSTW